MLPSAASRRIATKQVMSPDVISVRADMDLQEIAAFLTEKQISGAPVEDAEGRLIGVVSSTDIARAATEPSGWEGPPAEAEADFFLRGWEEAVVPEDLRGMHVTAAGLTVADIMTPRIYSIDAEAPISEAARLMLEAHVHRLLVTRGRRVVGIVTTFDLLRLLTEEQ